MKKIILALAISATLVSCNDYSTDTPKNTNGEPLKAQRIHGIESTSYCGTTYAIVEVDGREYLCQYNGGMCLIPKDTLK